MANIKDYQVDTELYGQAIEEIKQDFIKSNCIDPATAKAMANSIESHAVQAFYTMWCSAIRTNESHKESRARTQGMMLDPPDEKRLARLLPEDRERYLKMHEENVQQYKHDNEQRQKLFDQHNHRSMIVLLTKAGMSEATAQRIVDNHILPG